MLSYTASNNATNKTDAFYVAICFFYNKYFYPKKEQESERERCDEQFSHTPQRAQRCKEAHDFHQFNPFSQLSRSFYSPGTGNRGQLKRENMKSQEERATDDALKYPTPCGLHQRPMTATLTDGTKTQGSQQKQRSSNKTSCSFFPLFLAHQRLPSARRRCRCGRTPRAHLGRRLRHVVLLKAEHHRRHRQVAAACHRGRGHERRVALVHAQRVVAQQRVLGSSGGGDGGGQIDRGGCERGVGAGVHVRGLQGGGRHRDAAVHRCHDSGGAAGDQKVAVACGATQLG